MTSKIHNRNLLITTPLDEVWESGREAVVLGEWCYLYSKRKTDRNLSDHLLPYHWDDRKKAYNDSKYLNSINRKLLQELTPVLNKLHKVKYSDHTWNILIGYWLAQFSAVVFDRWNMVNCADKKYSDLETIVLDIDQENCIPSDSVEAVDFFINDRWNHVLYSIIMEKWTDIKIIKHENVDYTKTISTVRKQKLASSLMLKIKKIVLNSCSHSGEFLLSDVYLSFYDRIKLYLSLKCSVSFFSIHDDLIAIRNINYRKWHLSKKSHNDKFEEIVKLLLPKFMPKTFLEGFQECNDKSIKKYHKQKPKVIFTTNSHFGNDSFKCSIMHLVESGTRLIIGQHGGGPFHKYNSGTNFELSIANKYLSTGNIMTSDVIIDIGQLFNRQKYNKYNNKGAALLVTVAFPRYSYSLRSMTTAGQMLDYFEEQFDFYYHLTDRIKKQLNIRLYHGDYEWDQKQRWLDRFPDVKFDTNKKFDKSVQQSRLVVGTYAATTYNQTLASNIPTIMYWNPSHCELSAESAPFFEELKRVGVFHTTPQSAAKQVIKIWNNIDYWWYEQDLQDVRKRYCRAFAHKPKELVNKITKVLVEEANKYDLDIKKC